MKDEIICQLNQFTTVKKRGRFTYSERKGIDSIAFIFKKGNQFGLTLERKPPLEDRMSEKAFQNNLIFVLDEDDEVFLLTAFGGSNDMISAEEYLYLNEEDRITLFKKIVKEEGIEEAGYLLSEENISFITKSFVSTQQNQLCYLFLVNVDNAELTEKTTKDKTEMKAQLIWLSKEEILKTIDWKAKTILFHFLAKN